jgi:hypothetical protein
MRDLHAGLQEQMHDLHVAGANARHAGRVTKGIAAAPGAEPVEGFGFGGGNALESRMNTIENRLFEIDKRLFNPPAA